MRIIAVDDKPLPRRALMRAIEEAEPGADITVCANADEVLALPNLAAFDVAFIDIDMPGKNGIQLARELKSACPRLNIVFATGYGEYMPNAFEMHSSGYLMKPITSQKVRAELDNLRFPVGAPDDDRIVVQCFGDFEVFCHGEPLVFGRAKAKELFAYLVDRRGATCTMADVEAVFWGDEAGSPSLHSYMRTLVADMRATLDSVGHEDILVKHRGVVGIRSDAIKCDYYDYLAGDLTAINAFRGEYMRQYSWAESTLAQLGR